MGTEDMRRQAPNVERMLLGAEVAAVEAGARALKEAVSAAIRDWVTNVATTHYVIGPRSAGAAPGPGPRPAAGDRRRSARAGAHPRGRAAARVIACVGGGSNAIGTFTAFLDDADVELIRVEAGERASRAAGMGPRWSRGPPASYGALSSVLADDDSQILEAHSVSAGLDYPGVGPSTPTCATAAAPATWRSPTPTPSPPSEGWPGWRASFGARPSTPWRGCWQQPRHGEPSRATSSTRGARSTRDVV